MISVKNVSYTYMAGTPYEKAALKNISFDAAQRNIFTDVKEMKRLGFDVPVAAELAARLRRKGFKLPHKILTADELAEALL